MLLKKENTFCFDSESFRYLFASLNSMNNLSINSNKVSSNHLLNQICLQEIQNNINEKWISTEK